MNKRINDFSFGMPFPIPARDVNGRFVKRIQAEQLVKAVPKKALAGKPSDEPKRVDADIMSFVNELTDRVTKRGDAGECSYAKLLSNGEKIWHVGDICHARIPNTYPLERYTKDVRILAFAENISGHINKITGRGDIEAYRQFLEWMFLKSPWASHILDKNAEEAMKGSILLNCNSSTSQLSCTAIALRTAAEHGNQWLSVWKLLVDDGIDGYAAYITANICRYDKSNGRFFKFLNVGWHHVFNTEMGIENIKEFGKQGPFRHTSEKDYVDDRAHYNIHGTFSGYGKGGLPLNTIIPDGKDVTIGEGWNKIVTNVLTYKDVMSVAAKLS